MPLYEYRCEKCGQVLEVIQKSADSPAPKCLNCKKAKMTKEQSAPSFVIK